MKLKEGMIPLSLASALVVLPLLVSSAPFKDGDTVVFVGDSITHGGRYHAYLADYYRTRFPDARIRLVNSGYGGGTVGGVLPRFEEDIAEYDPTWVAINFGANDVNRDAFRPTEKGTVYLHARIECLKRFRRDFTNLVAQLHARVPAAQLMYVAPCTFDDGWTNPKDPHGKDNGLGCAAGISYIAASMLEFANADKAPFVNWYSLTREFLIRHQMEDPSFTVYYGDRTHLAPVGHELIAWGFLLDQNAPALVSSVSVDAGTLAAQAENAEVADVARNGRGVTFRVRAKALPFPLSDEAAKYADEFAFTKKLSHEGLRVTGLAAGEYRLLIDGQEVGRYNAAALAKGVELALNRKTPQFAQAMKVRDENERLRGREYEYRGYHYARNHYRGRAPIDDMAGMEKWAKENLGENAGKWDRVFAPYVKGYLSYWPKHKELREALWRDQDAVRKLAAPVWRTYAIESL